MKTRFVQCRKTTESLCAHLKNEDFVIQAAPEASPPKWHLAHTSWFYEQFLLRRFEPGFKPFHPGYAFLFNSYYETVGPFFERARRGTLSRPTVEEVFRYRAATTERVAKVLEHAASRASEVQRREVEQIVELGIQHEQQHQELLLTDTLLNFWMNPLRPEVFPYHERDFERASGRGASSEPAEEPPLQWLAFDEELTTIGFSGPGFSFDCERPAHRIYRAPFELASRLVTNGEFLEFVQAGGYQRPQLWLSEGWQVSRSQHWSTPPYWEYRDGQWRQMTMHGMQPLVLQAPVCHLSYYEADAYARWRGLRLPTEHEWESVARQCDGEGNFLDPDSVIAPLPASARKAASPRLPRQMFGDVWEWTRSPYLPYPGFKPEAGSIGEYNGKFMCNQMVLRGGSCATPASHIRATYRNFFPPEARWQFSGFRLARDL